MTPQEAQALRADGPGAVAAERDEEKSASARVIAAKTLLGKAPPEVVGFCDALYGGAPPEDITRFSSDSLATLAREVFARSQSRIPGDTLIDMFEFRPGEERGTVCESVFLAVNDDMPFLFDSFIGELGARNIRAHAAWNVMTHIARTRRPTRSSARSRISAAALFVNVMARISDGATWRSASR